MIRLYTLALSLMIFMHSPMIYGQENKDSSDLSLNALSFRSIGPAMNGGRVADIAIHPDNENVWYVAVGSGHVWKTTNAGTTWKPIFDGQEVFSIGQVRSTLANRISFGWERAKMSVDGMWPMEMECIKVRMMAPPGRIWDWTLQSIFPRLLCIRTTPMSSMSVRKDRSGAPEDNADCTKRRTVGKTGLKSSARASGREPRTYSWIRETPTSSMQRPGIGTERWRPIWVEDLERPSIRAQTAERPGRNSKKDCPAGTSARSAWPYPRRIRMSSMPP